MSQVDLSGNLVSHISRSYLVDFPVNRSLVPGSEEARKMTVTSGLNICGLSKNSGRLGLLEKMLLGSSIWFSMMFSLTWSAKATPQGRLIFRLHPLEQVTTEGEYSLWPTPRSCTAMGSSITQSSSHNEKRFPNLETVIGRRMFPTPNAGSEKWGGTFQELGGSGNSFRGTELASMHICPQFLEALMGFPITWTDLEH